jgi:serine/threonine protein kinase
MLVGTPQYMAPEQLEARDTDARTDLFAFGAVVYEMATGRPAFEGRSRASVIAAILEHHPTPISVMRQTDTRSTLATSARETVPPLLDQIIARCLAKDPDNRWQTANDLEQALRWTAESASKAAVSAWAPPVPRLRRIEVAWLTAGACLLIAAVIALVYTIGSSRRGAPDRRAVTFDVAPPEKSSFNQSAAFMALSPDGHFLAFIASMA